MIPNLVNPGEGPVPFFADGRVYQAVGGRHSIQAADSGDPLIDSQLGIDPIITSLVVGHPRRISNFGEGLFRRVGTPTWTFQYRVYGLELMQIRKAKRAMRAIIPHSDLSVDKLPGKLERYSWRTLADRDELLNSTAAERAVGSPTLGMRERYARASQRIVDLSMEWDRAQLVLAAGSYSQSAPDLDLTLAGGSEWNAASGDSRSDIRTMASLLAGQHGLTIEDVDVHLTNASFEAAIDDPIFVARRANYATAVANIEELRAFWGVRRVTRGDAIYSDDGLTLESLYGDIAVLDISSELRGFDEDEGTLDNFVRFGWTNGPGGIAGESWYERANTTWSFPWEGHENPLSINNKASAIIRNCAA
jgi:hypothetical protein